MVPSREVSQQRLARLAAAVLRHTPTQRYTVGDRLEEKAVAHPARPFLVYEDRQLSYGEVNAAANRLAHAAMRAGLGTGDVVALMMENRPEFIISWASLAKLGVTVALLNTNVRSRPLRHALEATHATHLIVGSECVENLASLGADTARVRTTYVCADPAATRPGVELPMATVDLDGVLAGMPTGNPDAAVRQTLAAGDDLFYMFTSGTTGLPKAARLSHMRYLGVGDGMSAIAGYGPEDVIACVLPLYHGAGGMVVISCALAQGATVFLRRKFSASRFWDDARRYGVTAFQYVGEICRYLVNQPPARNDRDHAVKVMMGAGLGTSTWKAFQQRFGIERVIEGWSATEANTSLINLDNRTGSCGRIPFKERHNGRLIRYDVETGTHPRNAQGFCIECGPGEVGEFIGMIPNLPDSGAGRFEGYTSARETEQKILRAVFQTDDQWYRSGDLLYHDEDDYYYFVDRIGDTYRWKSENVSTQEVAEVLGGFPGLAIANVYGVHVPDTEGRAGMAALVLRDPAAFDGRAFYEFTQQLLPPYAAPLFVRLVREADITATFKLRKVALQREGYDPRRVHDPIFIRTEAARTYVRLSTENLTDVKLACGL
ncbi:MAG: long-chain-acyl-CoA synthetase [Candidatus Binatia bacterium]